MRRSALVLASASMLCAALAGPSLAADPDPSFTVVNRSGMDVRTLQISPASSPEWGPDRTGGRGLRDGSGARIGLSGTCSWDMRVVFRDGFALEARRIDTCARKEVVLPRRPGAAPDGARPGIPRPGGPSRTPGNQWT